MESYIPISFLNDYIFCPRSIYFHQLYGHLNTELYQQTAQVAGTEAHAAVDEGRYSTRATVLQGLEVYSERYGLCGKIDTFDTRTGKLTERKRKIDVIYDGYMLQVYAQCHALREMGHTVRKINFYDMSRNKVHPVPLPEDHPAMQEKLEEVVEGLRNFDLEAPGFEPVLAKCQNCIYSNLCDYSLC
jgi:CRISPR-associated protein Cas4